MIQIYDLQQKTRLTSHHSSAAVVFWRWVAPMGLALVTADAVYHWAVGSPDSQPVKAFDRHPSTRQQGHQVVGYQASADGKWYLLSTTTAGVKPGTVDGALQLHSAEKGTSQLLPGHAGLFATLALPNRPVPATVLIIAEKKPGHRAKLLTSELRADKYASSEPLFRAPAQPIPYAAGSTEDFPVAMVVSNQRSLGFLVSQQGYVFLFDLLTARVLCRARVTESPIVAAVEHAASGGAQVLVQGGQVLLLRVSDDALVPYVAGHLRDSGLALSLATRLRLPGAEHLYTAEFSRLLQAGQVTAAVALAVTAPDGVLRTPTTLQALQAVAADPGQLPALQQYLALAVDAPGPLTQGETLELARAALDAGNTTQVVQWLAQSKLYLSEELGDLIVRHDAAMALTVYSAVGANDKVCACHYLCGQYAEMVAHAVATGCRADYATLLSQLIGSNPAAAVDFAVKLTCNETGFPLLAVDTAIDAFLAANHLKECTAFLLEALKLDRPEDGALQTRALEINFLGGYPQVAEAMLKQGIFSHYNKAFIGGLCARYGLTHQAQRHQVHILQEETATLLRQVQGLPQMQDWLRRRDAAEAAYHQAREAVPRDFFMISDCGRQRDAVLAEASSLPMTEGEYRSLGERHRDLLQALTEECDRCTEQERFKELRVVATLLQQLREVDMTTLPPPPPTPTPPAAAVRAMAATAVEASAEASAPELVGDPVYAPVPPRPEQHKLDIPDLMW